MRFREINEAHYRDLYPKTFEEFRNKYLPYINDKSLYVNFTDVINNTINKSFSKNPNHADPIGLYAYPLEYVLNHPADIEYGQQAPYLRVIRDVSRNKVILNTITHDEAVTYLTRMGIEEPEKKMVFVARRNKERFNGNLPGHQLFDVMQKYRKVGQNGVTPNAEQTRLLLRAGIDALEDRSPNRAQSVIYSGEPEQIVFLTRSAFKVIDVFNLRAQLKTKKLDFADPYENIRKLPGLIAQKIGDRIVATNVFDRTEALSVYTAAKRKIVVSIGYNFSGSHREYTTSNDSSVSVALFGPDFQTIRMTESKTLTFEEIANHIASAFMKRKPANRQGYTLWGDVGPQADHINDLLSKIAKALRVPYTVPTTEQGKLRVYLMVKKIDALHRYTAANTKTSFLKSVTDVINSLFTDEETRLQMTKLFSGIVGSKRVGSSFRRITDIARALKIPNDFEASADVNEETESMEIPNGFIFRKGSELYISINDNVQPIAKIENMVLENWNKPFQNFNSFTVFLPYAKYLCEFLNEHGYIAKGYFTFMAQFYGVIYAGEKWMLFKDYGKNEYIGDVLVKTFADGNKKESAYAYVNGETTYEIGDGVTVPWLAQENLFSLDEQGRIDHLSDNLCKYVREKSGIQSWVLSKFKPDLYTDSADASKKVWDSLDRAGFDFFKYIKTNGYKISPKMSASDLQVLGMKKNEKTGKIGKTWADVAESVGEYAGKKVYSIVYHGKINYFFDVSDEHPTPVLEIQSAFQYVPERVVGVMQRRVLTIEERKAIREIIKQHELSIPAIFKPLLTIKPQKREQ